MVTLKMYNVAAYVWQEYCLLHYLICGATCQKSKQGVMMKKEGMQNSASQCRSGQSAKQRLESLSPSAVH